jgi:RimJ/RimL family protein N-acetyltransferase
MQADCARHGPPVIRMPVRRPLGFGRTEAQFGLGYYLNSPDSGATNDTAMITEEDFIDFTCPYCRDAVSFPMQHRDSLQQCPMCFESLVVPEKTGAPGRKIAVPFSTARLTLRRLAPADWNDLLEFLSDEETYRYISGHPLDEEAILRWLESDAHAKLTTPDQPFCLGLALREGGKLIGYTGLRLSAPDLLQAHVTIQLNRAFQKQGFAFETLKAVLRFCFQDTRLHRVTATCDSRNSAAVKLLEKAGLRREGEFVKDNLLHGEWTNTLCYATLREEYTDAVAAQQVSQT